MLRTLARHDRALPRPRARSGRRGGAARLRRGRERPGRRARRAGAACSTCRRSTRRPTRRSARRCCALPKADRRALLLSYLGYPYFDIATLPLLQGEGLDEFDPIKVDRISPERRDRDPQGRAARDAEGPPVQQLRRLLQPRLSRERLSLGPPPRRRPADRHRQFARCPRAQHLAARRDRRAEARRLPRHPRRGKSRLDGDRRPVRRARRRDRLSGMSPAESRYPHSVAPRKQGFACDARTRRRPFSRKVRRMQFLKTLFWVVLAVRRWSLFADQQLGSRCTINLWGGLSRRREAAGPASSSPSCSASCRP